MSVRITSFESTPNPNALKCLLDRRVCDERLSYRDADSAAEHPLAARIFEIEGIVGVMMLDDWMTVLKTPDAAWRTIRARVQRAVAEAG